MTAKMMQAEKITACGRCACPDLRWGKHTSGWRMFDANGKLHVCYKKISPTKRIDIQHVRDAGGIRQPKTPLQAVHVECQQCHTQPIINRAHDNGVHDVWCQVCCVRTVHRTVIQSTQTHL